MKEKNKAAAALGKLSVLKRHEGKTAEELSAYYKGIRSKGTQKLSPTQD